MSRSAARALVLAVACVAGVTGCSSKIITRPDGGPAAGAAITADVPVKVVEIKGRYEKQYVLGPYDEIEVFVARVPDVSRTVTVRPDGFISLPIVDEVKAAGLTPAELDDVLTKRLSRRLVKPEVTVIVKQLREPRVYVLGQVTRPGPVSMKNASTAAEALSMAGGVLATGDERVITLIRISDDGKAKAMVMGPFEPGQPGPYLKLATIPLEPEDVLFVPESNLSQIARLSRDLAAPFSSIAAAIQPYFQVKVIETIKK